MNFGQGRLLGGESTSCRGRGEWSVSVSGNWRITFEEAAGTVDRLNLEDYHRWLTME